MKAVIYARVSTADQTTDNQTLELRRVAKRNGWTIEEVFEDTISGAKPQRPALQRLLQGAIRKEFDVVLIWDVSRLGRSLKHLVTLLDDLHAKGIDLYFHQQAKRDGKPIAGLESIQEQVSFLAGLGEGEESEFILLSLRDLETIAVDIESMLGPWREGNVAELDALFVDSMKEETPEAYELLVAGRNRSWMQELEAMFTDSDTEFVLVGVAHLIGNNGLIEMLRARGYTVRQL